MAAVIPYWVAQLIGGLSQQSSRRILYTNDVKDSLVTNPGTGVEDWRAMLMELVAVFLFLLASFTVATETRHRGRASSLRWRSAAPSGGAVRSARPRVARSTRRADRPGDLGGSSAICGSHRWPAHGAAIGADSRLGSATTSRSVGDKARLSLAGRIDRALGARRRLSYPPAMTTSRPPIIGGSWSSSGQPTRATIWCRFPGAFWQSFEPWSRAQRGISPVGNPRWL